MIRHFSRLAVLALTTVATAQQGASHNEKGSVFILPKVEIRQDAAGQLVQDTFIHLQNDFPQDVRIQLFYVNGDPPLPANGPEPAHPGWNRVDNTLELTASHPVHWSVATGEGIGFNQLAPFTILDPAPAGVFGRPDPEGSTDRVLRGYVVGWATDNDGREISWNHLSADATVVDYRDGSTWGYNAAHFPALGGLAAGTLTGTPGTINLDGIEFAAGPDTLAFNFVASGSSAYSGTSIVTHDTDLSLLPLEIDLRQASSGPTTTRAIYDVWNENEVKFSGAARCVSCWDERLLSLENIPNHFLLGNLQTDVGRARIDGVASQICNEYPSDCCFANGSPGCSDATCVTLICGLDPFCCSDTWDEVCAEAAIAQCTACVGTVISTPSPLLGVAAKYLAYAAGDRSLAGTHLMSEGTETATLQFDVLGPPPGQQYGPDDAPAAVALAALRKRDETVAPAPGTAGPATPPTTRASATYAGSLFILPEIEVRFDAAGQPIGDTFVHLSNLHPSDVLVQLVFVNGDAPLDLVPGQERAHTGWNWINTQVHLTGNQPIYWSVLDAQPGLGGAIPMPMLDPGAPAGRPDTDSDGAGTRVLRGYLVGWAVNDAGEEIRWDHLAADATVVHYPDSSSYAYAAYHHRVADDAIPHGAPTGTPGQLELDGVEYTFAADRNVLAFPAEGGLAYASPLAPSASSSTSLTLMPVDLDHTLASAGPTTTKANFQIWNANEVQFSGMFRCVTCWGESPLSDDGVPNHTLVQNLQTAVGRARLDGQQSQLCDVDADPQDGLPLGADPNDVVSSTTALQAVTARAILFSGPAGGAVDRAGHQVTGTGFEAATIAFTLAETGRFNIDFASGFGVPSNAYGAASGQTGTWQQIIDFAPLTPVPLVALDGSPTVATITSDGFASGGSVNNAGTSGDDERLMDDLFGFGVPGDPTTFTVRRIPNGAYEVWTYAWAPDSATLTTLVDVPGSPQGPQIVGGLWPGGHALGTTYAFHTVNVSNGELRVVVDSAPQSLGSLNGIQIRRLIPCPGDIDGDGNVGFTDLNIVLAAWGPCIGCPGDIDGDDNVGFTDLNIVLGAWGPCP